MKPPRNRNPYAADVRTPKYKMRVVQDKRGKRRHKERYDQTAGPIHYCEKHDAYYDADKDEWTETACGHEDCTYCPTRPAKPSEVVP